MIWLLLRLVMFAIYLAILVIMWRARFSGPAAHSPQVRAWIAGFILIALGTISYLLPRLTALNDTALVIGSTLSVVFSLAALVMIVRGQRGTSDKAP